jgi:hypothetical protein
LLDANSELLAEVGDFLYKAIYRIAKMRSLSIKGVTCAKYNIKELLLKFTTQPVI